MSKTIFFLGTSDDQEYLPKLKSCVGAATVFASLAPIQTFVEVTLYCKKREATAVIFTSQTLLAKLTGDPDAKISNYMGSYWLKDGIEFVCLPPLSWLVRVNYGKFLVARYISKILQPQDWTPSTKFSYTLANPENVSDLFNQFQSAFLIAVDSETFKVNLAIRCVGYTAFYYQPNGAISSVSCVLPCDSEFMLTWIRKFNWELQAPKVLQNGKYDCAYFARYNVPLYNYLYDTINMMHCWYAELPRDLGFLTTFLVRDAWYWKDMGDSQDLQTYYEYCARDTWGTGNAAIAWLMQSPEWAKENYLQEFPLVFPSHMCEMRGLKRDAAAKTQVRTELKTQIAEKNNWLSKCLGVDNFNVNSPIQMKALFRLLGCADLPGQDEKQISKAQFRHPLNNHLLEAVLDIRGWRKSLSTYVRSDEDITKTSPGGDKDYKGVVLYAINPHGTDTGRNASKEHHFWCGQQVQNWPRGPEIKQTIAADPGFLLAESDLEQAESRDTAHIAGDEKLISAVSGTRDFHSVNASAFFGKQYEDIYDDEKAKTKDKPLRDLAKRVNHGANYNMGANVLVETMGLKKIYESAKMLGLPKLYTPKKIAEYLLEQFHKTYPHLSKTYYPGVIHDIETTKLLVGATGWTRYCFGDPKNNKSDLNAYVAHAPQSLNAMVLNKAFLKVFYEIALHPQHSKNFKLCAQIHDSILFQFRAGHEYLCEMVKKAMEIPVTVTGYDGKTRTFTVPAAVKAGKDGKGATHWSLTE